MGQHSRPQVVNTHTHIHTQALAHTLSHMLWGRQRNLFQLTSLMADLLRACKRMGVCVRAQDENKCWRRLQVLRAAGRRCLYQNPSGGRECGERERERRRREETVGNCGDNGKKYEETKQTEEEGAWKRWIKWRQIKVGLMRDAEGQKRTRDDRQEETRVGRKQHRERGWNEPDTEGITCSSATCTAVRAGRPSWQTTHPPTRRGYKVEPTKSIDI